MAWLWVLGAAWLVLAALIALLVGRAIRQEEDPPATGDPPAEKRPGLHAPRLR